MGNSTGNADKKSTKTGKNEKNKTNEKQTKNKRKTLEHAGDKKEKASIEK